MLPSVLWTERPPVLMLIMIRQDNHHNHPRHDQSQSKTSIPLPSDTFHDKLFPIDQRDVLINSIVLLVQVVPRFWHSSATSVLLTECPPSYY